MYLKVFTIEKHDRNIIEKIEVIEKNHLNLHLLDNYQICEDLDYVDGFSAHFNRDGEYCGIYIANTDKIIFGKYNDDIEHDILNFLRKTKLKKLQCI